MKLKILTILGLTAITALTASAQTAEQFYAYGDETGLLYEWTDASKTAVKTASWNDVEYYTVSRESWDPTDVGLTYLLRVKEGVVVDDQDMLVGPNWLKDTRDLTIPSEIQLEENGDYYPVVAIGKYGFASASDSQSSTIGTLTLPSSITTIEEGAFFGYNINNVNFSEGLQEIEDCAFYGNSNCTGTLTIPNTVTYIGKASFYGWNSLETLILGQNVKIIDDYAFAFCSSHLDHLVIPDSVTKIGGFAFYKSESMHVLELGKGLEEIGEYAFYLAKMDRIDHLEFPASLKKIGPMAFYLTAAINTVTDFYCHAGVPPIIDPSSEESGWFETFGMSLSDYQEHINQWGDIYQQQTWIYGTICLHVPQGTVEAYRSAPGWKNFKCIIEDLTDMKKAMDLIIGYEFMVPGEKEDIYNMLPAEERKRLSEKGITKDKLEWLFDFQFRERGAKWDTDKGEENSVISISNVNDPIIVTARNFGQKVATCMWTDADGRKEVIGYVAIFVCPTVTVAYDLSAIVADPKKPETGGNQSPDDEFGSSQTPQQRIQTYATDGDVMTERLATYEYRIVYNSYPTVAANAASGFEIMSVQHGDATQDEAGNTIPDGELTNVEDDDDTDTNGAYIIPQQPITNNRIVLLEAQRLNSEDYIPTGVQKVQVSDDISITVNGLTVSIEGAKPESAVLVTNLKGQVVYNAVGKTFTLTEKGIYIIRVEDVTIKALVR